MEVALLTAGWDRPYAFGLTTSLLAQGVRLDVICGADLDAAELRDERQVKLLTYREEAPPGAGLLRKTGGIIRYYARLIRYAWNARPTVFHILWNNKFDTLDRVFLMLYYRFLGKRIVFTAHNVNAGARDNADSVLNRLTLRCQYRLSDHIFVHTDKMKLQLVEDFDIRHNLVTVIPFGINNSVPETALTPAEARRKLGIGTSEKTILFFGNIAPYKGLEYLLTAFRRLIAGGGNYRLVVAGRPKKGSDEYWSMIQDMLRSLDDTGKITLKIEFIPDAETEVYFKAADVLALPYTSIFQSGVLFLGYSFGLPVVAADVGSLRTEIVEGVTGFVCAPQDADTFRETIERYFSSELFENLDGRRPAIREYARAKYSWEPVAKITRNVYEQLDNGR